MLKLIQKSIIIKLWLVMILLVLITLWATGLVQTRVLEEKYYGQHIEGLTAKTRKVAEYVESSANPETISNIARTMGINIMVVDAGGVIKLCQGMGMNMSSTDRVDVFGHHGIPWNETEFNKILQGQRLYYIGHNRLIDKEVLSVALPYQKPGDRGIVMLSTPLSPITGRVAVLQRVTIYTGIGGIIIATLLSFILSRSISSPLVQMNKVAKAISRGDYSKKVRLNREDEIGVLAESLNSLSAELQDKIAALERLDNARRDFITNVSHEIRTPLSVIQAYTEALSDGIAETREERQEYLDSIYDEILRLRRLVAEVLDLRKLETGIADFDLQPLNIQDLVQEVSSRMNTLALNKNIQLQQQLDQDSSATIKANRDKIKQVFINLLDNAIRATPEGGHILIQAQKYNHGYKFCIKDSGPGISEDEQQLIWEKFTKLDRSRNRSGAGTGLGLPLVKRIIEAHGGEIWIESKPGKGAAFIFTLPG